MRVLIVSQSERMKTDYEILADEWDTLTQEYFDRCDRIRERTPIVGPQGFPTTVELLAEWEKYRKNVASLFEKHGWTEEEFEAEICRRAF